MKNPLSKPKIVIPVVAVIVFIVGTSLYKHVGVAPVVPASLSSITSTDATIISDNNVSLSFSKSGPIETVAVKEGQKVKAGDILATLSAPDAEGAVTEAKGALDLAQAQFASLNAQYATTKAQQDLLVENAYKTLLSGTLEGVPDRQDANTPIISGTYTCDTEGSYILKPYESGDSDSGYSINFSGLESGTLAVKYDNAVPLGNCGLQIKFNHVTSFDPQTTWTISIPNTQGADYLANKNAYDLAMNTRDKTLADLEVQIGSSGGAPSVAQAQIDAAEGAYQMALGAYQDNVITSPVDGTVTFVDDNLKVGQMATAGKSVISISQ